MESCHSILHLATNNSDLEAIDMSWGINMKETYGGELFLQNKVHFKTEPSQHSWVSHLGAQELNSMSDIFHK